MSLTVTPVNSPSYNWYWNQVQSPYPVVPSNHQLQLIFALPHNEVHPVHEYNGTKQRVLMHGHQGWNVRHGLCHIYMRYVYIYIWVVFSLCFFCCLFITVTWWYMWCIEWASGNQEEVQACLVTLWLFIISCYSLYKTTLGLLFSCLCLR